MKKLISIIKKTLVLGIILSIGLSIYIKNYWKKIISEFEIKELISEIKKAKNLPEKFYAFYKIEKPKSLTTDLNGRYFYGILNSDFKKPPSSQVAILSELYWQKLNYRLSYKFMEVSLSWEIENQTSQRDCLNWVAENCSFIFQCVGLKQASMFYFNKEIEELNDRELASFVIMMKNPRQYNPKRKKELLNNKVDQLILKTTIPNKRYN